MSSDPSCPTTLGAMAHHPDACSSLYLDFEPDAIFKWKLDLQGTGEPCNLRYTTYEQRELHQA
jgi:hypothetical protein